MPAGDSSGFEPFLSALWEPRFVNEQLLIDIEALAEEVDRYLAAVDLFRVLECEPTWRPESAPQSSRPVSPSMSLRVSTDVELH